MKHLLAILCLALAACGEQSTPVSTARDVAPPPAVPESPTLSTSSVLEPATVAPIIGNQTQEYGLVLYVGDDITWRSCQVSLTAPWLAFQFEEPDGACLGVEGETSAGTLARFAQALAMHPRAIVLTTGLNDVRDGFNNQGAIVDMVTQGQAAGIVMILGTLPPSTIDVTAWNAGIHAIAAQYGAGLADYYAGIMDPSIAESPKVFTELLTDPMLTPDGVYPSAAGFQVMWGIVCEPLDPLGVFTS